MATITELAAAVREADADKVEAALAAVNEAALALETQASDATRRAAVLEHQVEHMAAEIRSLQALIEQLRGADRFQLSA